MFEDRSVTTSEDDDNCDLLQQNSGTDIILMGGMEERFAKTRNLSWPYFQWWARCLQCKERNEPFMNCFRGFFQKRGLSASKWGRSGHRKSGHWARETGQKWNSTSQTGNSLKKIWSHHWSTTTITDKFRELSMIFYALKLEGRTAQQFKLTHETSYAKAKKPQVINDPRHVDISNYDDYFSSVLWPPQD